MEQFLHTYRLHGATEIEARYELGFIKIREPRTQAQSVSGALEFTIFADNYQEAQNRIEAENFYELAEHIVSALAFIWDTGLSLGAPYKLKSASGSNHWNDGSFGAGRTELEPAIQVFQYMRSNLAQSEKLSKGLRWYSYALSTETDEDALVALWTGLESLVNPQSNRYNYTTQEEQAIEQAKQQVLTQLGSPNSDRYKWVEGRFGQIKGGVQNETKDEAVQNLAQARVSTRYLSNTTDVCETTTNLYDARNAIVHGGETLENAAKLRLQAKELLKELLLSFFENPYAGIFENHGQPRRTRYLHVAPEIWFPVIFGFDTSQHLSREDVKKRAFAITRDFYEGYRLPVDNFCGANEPLTESNGHYSLNQSYFSHTNWA